MFRRVARSSLLCVGLLTMGATAIRSAEAQTWKAQVDREILTSPVVYRLMDADYRLTHELQYGVLRPNWQHDVTVYVRRGVSYAFVGKCDNDCHDIDLQLLDDYGRLITQDLSRDDRPVVLFTPSRSMTVRLRVSVPGCSTVDCGWAALVLGR
jgi:hypothetical protein